MSRLSSRRGNVHRGQGVRGYGNVSSKLQLVIRDNAFAFRIRLREKARPLQTCRPASHPFPPQSRCSRNYPRYIYSTSTYRRKRSFSSASRRISINPCNRARSTERRIFLHGKAREVRARDATLCQVAVACAFIFFMGIYICRK